MAYDIFHVDVSLCVCIWAPEVNLRSCSWRAIYFILSFVFVAVVFFCFVLFEIAWSLTIRLGLLVSEPHDLPVSATIMSYHN